MIEKLYRLTLVVAVLISASGCMSSFKGDFAFANDSKHKIWVEDLHGFDVSPPCGILIPGATAGSSMFQRMPIPAKCEIEWWYIKPEYTHWQEGKKETRLSTVDLQTIPKGFSGKIQFHFSDTMKWSIQLEEQ